ncbi:MAG: FkbM family methyltransferase [Dysgonamonadaceae bacterium]|nr:FkbM family methyltransferase [Dysgonamonadaceae bacterium]
MILKNIIRRLKANKSRSKYNKDFYYPVGNYTLLFPSDHPLPEYQKAFRLYDKKLGLIVNAINRKIQSGFVVDIGANIGDTAALIRQNSDFPILCIEGDENYLKYLCKNIEQLANTEIYKGFVGEKNTVKNLSIDHQSGTAKLVEDSANTIELKDMETILTEVGKKATDIRLLKIDTDGYDFSILLSISSIIKTCKLNLFFEYDLSFTQNAFTQAKEVIAMLEKENYYLIIYDNYGHLITILTGNLESQMKYFDAYLKSCKTFGGGICYYDIFATTDKSLLEDILKAENNIFENNEDTV